MNKQAKRFLFISEGYSSGSNHIIQLSAKKLLERGHTVQVLLRHGTVPNHINTLLPSSLYYDVELNQYIDQDPENPDEDTSKYKRHLELNADYLFFSHNSSTSYTDKNHLLSVLKFMPDYIIVGNRHNFLTYEDLDELSNATGAMVYLLALDMSHLTGGCHFAWDCVGYKIGCDQIRCPAVNDEKDDFISSENFKNKQEIFARDNFRLIAGTQWTKNQARKSKLFKDQKSIHNISAFIDIDIFNNKSRQLARQVLDLSDDHFYILSGSENPRDKRKGYVYFVEALKLLWQYLTEYERKKIVILSASKYKDQAFQDIPFDKKHIDYIKDERLLSYLYQAADLYINTSIEDSGPSMLMEALVCGTPVVSFKMGAAEEFIRHGENGYLVNLYDCNTLAKHIYEYLQLPLPQREQIRESAHQSTVNRVDHNQALDKLFDYLQEEESRATVSVAMCTYNGEAYLAEQLDSIISQNYPVHEIVICDDCSTDQTIEIIEEYIDKYPDLIKLYANEENIGTVKNFEKAINLCTQDYIFLCDQDDVWYHHKVRTILKYFKNHPKIEAVFHDLHIYHTGKENESYTMWDSLYYTDEVRKNIPLYDFLGLFYNVVTGMTIALRKNEKFPIKFCDKATNNFLHDYQIAINYSRENTIYPIAECLGRYRQHENQQLGCIAKTSFVDCNELYETPFFKYKIFKNRIKQFSNINHQSKYRNEILDWLCEGKKQLFQREGYWRVIIGAVKVGVKHLLYILNVFVRRIIKQTIVFLGLWEKFDEFRKRSDVLKSG